MKRNPFLISGYKSPNLFCDRELELSRITNAIDNQRNITLISSRRMGKTGLIKHYFNSINRKDEIIPVYIDILGTTDLREFIETFSNAVLQKIAKSESALKRFIKKIAALRPVLSFDTFTGEPKISMDIRNENEALFSLEIIFRVIEENKRFCVFAIDEFQQIGTYPEKNTEAILRTYIQHAQNLAFIFSGSKKHMLSAMFSEPSRPFFSSSEMMFLEAIDKMEYFSFIQDQFQKGGKTIDQDALRSIENYSLMHTFYVQFLCNRLFGSYKHVTKKEVDKTLHLILLENEPIYASYLNLLTTKQYKILRAIALEGYVTSPTASYFLEKHSLGAASSVAQAVESLIGKEFISEEPEGLFIQDKFLGQWIRMKAA